MCCIVYNQYSPKANFYVIPSYILMLYNIIQLYCLCFEKVAFWLVIYVKTTTTTTTVNTFYNRTLTIQQHTELKTVQIQKQHIAVIYRSPNKIEHTISSLTYQHVLHNSYRNLFPHITHLILSAPLPSSD